MGALLATLSIAKGLDLACPLPPAPRYYPIMPAADGSVPHAFLNPIQKGRMKTELAELWRGGSLA